MIICQASVQRNLMNKDAVQSALRFGVLSAVGFQQKRFARPRLRLGTNWITSNPSTYMGNLRYQDPKQIDKCTREIWRPRLIESIIPTYLLPEKEAPPWPYKEKGYKNYHQCWDWTTKRFDENTRLVTVEGNLGTGCNEFGKALAERLGFHFIREPQIEDMLVDSYGIDKRDYYHLLPEKFCLFDTEMFFTAPDHPMVNSRQYFLFALKLEAYMNALAHIMNTGQGVVMVRTVLSDNAFVRAMYSKGYLSDDYVKFYHKSFRRDCLFYLNFLPHIVLYLDAPPSFCMEQIKKRGRPWEVDSEVFDYDYIATYEKEMKNHLQRMAKDSEVISLDWTNPMEMDAILDEIYSVDLSYDWNEDDKFISWQNVPTEFHWNKRRIAYTSKTQLLELVTGATPQVKELCYVDEDIRDVRYIIGKIVGEYQPTFNVSRGDSLRHIFFPESRYNNLGVNWYEYIWRDNFYLPVMDKLIEKSIPVDLDIPDEEWQPKRFDPKCLKYWNVNH